MQINRKVMVWRRHQTQGQHLYWDPRQVRNQEQSDTTFSDNKAVLWQNLGVGASYFCPWGMEVTGCILLAYCWHTAGILLETSSIPMGAFFPTNGRVPPQALQGAHLMLHLHEIYTDCPSPIQKQVRENIGATPKYAFHDNNYINLFSTEFAICLLFYCYLSLYLCLWLFATYSLIYSLCWFSSKSFYFSFSRHNRGGKGRGVQCLQQSEARPLPVEALGLCFISETLSHIFYPLTCPYNTILVSHVISESHFRFLMIISEFNIRILWQLIIVKIT